MAMFDGAELDLIWSEHRPETEIHQSFTTVLALLERLIAYAFKVDLDTVEVIEFEPPENGIIMAQVVCSNEYESENAWEVEINLTTGEVRKD